MQDNNRRFAGEMAQLDADLGRAIAQRASLSAAERDRFSGEDNVLLRGLLADMALASTPSRR